MASGSKIDQGSLRLLEHRTGLLPSKMVLTRKVVYDAPLVMRKMEFQFLLSPSIALDIILQFGNVSELLCIIIL